MCIKYIILLYLIINYYINNNADIYILSILIHIIYINKYVLKQIIDIHSMSIIDYNINEIKKQSIVIQKLSDDKYYLTNKIKYLEKKKLASNSI